MTMPASLRLRLIAAAAVVGAVAGAVTLALASLGGAAVESAGATMSASGTVNDDGVVYDFGLNATEVETGRGQVGHNLSGPSLSLCTVSGPGGTPGTTVGTGLCGGASFQAVSIEGCKAEIQAHGYSHSDFPFDPIYLGMMTVEIEFEKTGPNSGKLKTTVYTPKGKNEIDGVVNAVGAGGGPIGISTCP
jgi:hypothetical protein